MASQLIPSHLQFPLIVVINFIFPICLCQSQHSRTFAYRTLASGTRSTSPEPTPIPLRNNRVPILTTPSPAATPAVPQLARNGNGNWNGRPEPTPIPLSPTRSLILTTPSPAATPHVPQLAPNGNGNGTRRPGVGKKIAIAALIAGVVILVATIVIFCCLRRKFSTDNSFFVRKNRKNAQTVEEFLKNCGPLASTRYKYSDIKKMTNSFKEKVGQGGYGGVFKGKLSDGRIVAVKVLSESKGNGEEFINEVASISRTSHVNIVSLLGFCVEGSKRALIYEFMPNGSLEKFIYDEKPVKTHPQLLVERLYQIAVGIARGLEYLHRGCRTRILHFDIKPHNILLDQDFCPKISDFGLAKLCPQKESIISMVGTRGTIGFIAPEVFSRNFGGVSHKSDVYSYGMMILEMVGGRRNVDVGMDHTSEIYFPHWIYLHLKLDEDLGLHGIETKEDEEIARKMILVGLWCIQTNPTNRPSMSKVVEMLEGSLELLQIPPKPYLSSPSRSPTTSSST